jgi:hypothetical protein
MGSFGYGVRRNSAMRKTCAQTQRITGKNIPLAASQQARGNNVGSTALQAGVFQEKGSIMRKHVALSLLFSIAMVGAASAAPAHFEKKLAAQSGVVEVQYRGHHSSGSHHSSSRGHTYRGPSHNRYRAGSRYRSAPHGWHRYNARPRDWRTRGCVIVGPLWFCP